MIDILINIHVSFQKVLSMRYISPTPLFHFLLLLGIFYAIYPFISRWFYMEGNYKDTCLLITIRIIVIYLSNVTSESVNLSNIYQDITD